MGKESVIVSSRSLQPTGNIRGQYAGVDGGHQGKRIWKPGVMWGQVLQSHFFSYQGHQGVLILSLVNGRPLDPGMTQEQHDE